MVWVETSITVTDSELSSKGYWRLWSEVRRVEDIGVGCGLDDGKRISHTIGTSVRDDTHLYVVTVRCKTYYR